MAKKKSETGANVEAPLENEEQEPKFQFHPDIVANCPPSDVGSVRGLTIYRLAKKETFSQRDTYSHYERDSARWNTCEAFGLSVFLSLQDIKTVALANTRLGSFVYKCEGKPEYGKIKHTPSGSSDGHHTFWVDQRVDRFKIFELVGHVDNL